MSRHVLVTMQVTTTQAALAATTGNDIEARLAEVVRECFDADAEHASISVQAYDPDAATEDDVCATCGCVIGDAEQHVAWHRSDVRRVAELHAGQRVADEPQFTRCFGEEPANA